nr:Btn1 [Starmerella bombicola]
MKHGVAYSFWGFGLLNNVLYVVILSAAIDLVGNETPKGLVLLADVLPSLVFKVSAPFFFHTVPYKSRIFLLIALSFFGMQIVANVATLQLKLLGIVMASLSSGLGEVTFLQLTHYFNKTAVHAWSSGTGAAGLIGSFVFMVMTSWLAISTPVTLRLFSLAPFCHALLYWYILPRPETYQSADDVYSQHPLPRSDDRDTSAPLLRKRPKLERIRELLFPFVLPLMTVYLAEYVINQGVSPTLLFDLIDMPMFRHYRDAYVFYGVLYQIGVFISRSSGSWVRIRHLWLIAILQLVNLGMAILQSLYLVNPSIYISFAFMVYEGLLGGAAYVNTFMQVSEAVPKSEREFAMGTVTMSDSAGVAAAALISMWLETSLCHYQVDHGRPWCELTT